MYLAAVYLVKVHGLHSTPRKLRCRGFGGLIAPVRASIPIRVRRALRMAVEVESIAENYMQGWGDASPVGPIGNAVRELLLGDEPGRSYPRGAEAGTRCSTIYEHYEFFDLGYYQIAMDCLRQAYGDPARSGQSGPLCRAVCTRPPPCPRTAHDAALAADPGANGTKRRACSRRRWHARRTIASRFSPQPPTAAEMRQDQVPVSPHDATA